MARSIVAGHLSFQLEGHGSVLRRRVRFAPIDCDDWSDVVAQAVRVAGLGPDWKLVGSHLNESLSE